MLVFALARTGLVSVFPSCLPTALQRYSYSQLKRELVVCSNKILISWQQISKDFCCCCHLVFCIFFQPKTNIMGTVPWRYLPGSSRSSTKVVFMFFFNFWNQKLAGFWFFFKYSVRHTFAYSFVFFFLLLFHMFS